MSSPHSEGFSADKRRHAVLSESRKQVALTSWQLFMPVSVSRSGLNDSDERYIDELLLLLSAAIRLLRRRRSAETSVQTPIQPEI
jgi:hypothetical protein